MKKICFTLIALFTASMIIAQSPQAFKYQAIARDEAGNVLSVWDISLRVSLIQEGADGQAIYTETHKVQTNIYGLINLVIGEGDIVKGDFNSIKWSENRHYIKMEMDIDGGEDYKDVGTSQLYAVPYALYADEAGHLKQPEPSYKTAQKAKQVKSPQSSSGPRGTPNSKISSSGNSWLNALTGNVGIGTTTPAGILDIAGAYHFPSTDGISGQVLQTDGSGEINWEDQIDSTDIAEMGYVTGGNYYRCIDYDGNAYPTFQIGTQVWMAENLRVTHYRNSDAIPNVTDIGAWSVLTTGAYCWYDNDQPTNEKYGALYNWYTVDDSRGLCPEGWHVPTDTEWTTLTTYLGGTNVAGGKMKSTSDLWNSPNTDATNNSNFSGLPSGFRYSLGNFFYVGSSGYWWSSTVYSSSNAWYRLLSYNYGYVDVSYGNKLSGFSVRCLRD